MSPDILGVMSLDAPAVQGSGSPIEFEGGSQPGRVRTVNQDAFFAGPAAGRAFMALVADGMGGHRSGEVASQKAVEIMRRELERSRNQPPVTIARAVQMANLAIFDHSVANPEHQGMGTTCTVVVLDDQVGLVGHVGDSRAYLLRGGELRQLTLDHSWVADRVRQGILSEEEARQHRWRNVITNTLGSNPQVKLDLLHFRVEPGDVILLCSDGVSMLLSTELMKRVLTENSPQEACRRLLEEADGRGSPDNITAVVLRVNSVEARNKKYRLPEGKAFEPASVKLGETLGGVREVEETYPVNDTFSKMKRQAWYPYRFWLLGSLYLLLLILLFSVWG